MSAHNDFGKKNDQFIANFEQGSLGIIPTKKLLVVTCMDARVDPASQLGLALGEAHFVRNAGGSTKEALRSIIISQRLLGTREIAVVHHTGCGMLTFTTPGLQTLIKEAEPDNGSVAEEVNKINFLEFPHLEESVKNDIRFLEEHPLVLKGTKITGWIYHIESGKAVQIV